MKPVPPLDPTLARLLESESGRCDIPGDAQSRVLERLQSTLAVPLVGGGTTPPPARGGGVAGGGGLAMAGLGLLLGAAVGAVGYGTLAPQAHSLGSVVRPLVIPLPAPSAQSPTPPPAIEPPDATPPAARASNAVGRDVDLAAERALLEVARTALARGDTASAMAALNAHAKRFPRGRLLEERESLAVQALAAAGKRDEARRRADQFRKRSPDSMLLPAVEEALDQRR